MKKQINRRSFFKFVGSAGASMFAAACKAPFKTSKLAGTKANVEEQVFDYIVVGSGAGGGPLAVNLAKAGFHTLLLEAGDDQGDREVYQVPAFHTKSSEDPSMSWDFYVKHFNDPAKDQLDTKYVKDKGILYPRAGTLGGCTAHNAMVTIYPLASDWDQLGKDVGDATYNSKVMRQYFSFVENADYQGDKSRKQGWLPVRYASAYMVLKDRAIIAMMYAAARSLQRKIFTNTRTALSLANLVANSDTNSPSTDRDLTEKLALIPQATTAKGRRYGVRDLIKANQNLSTLHVRTNCFVTRLQFAEQKDANGDDVIVGVEYASGPQSYKAFKTPSKLSDTRNVVIAKREVILAAGTFNTPQILMLSGIGPKEELEKFKEADPNFVIRRNLPGVGANLQDRYELGVVQLSEKPLDIARECKFQPTDADSCFKTWNNEGSGVYTANGIVNGILKKSKPNLVSPDLVIFLLPTKFSGYFPGYSNETSNSKSFTTWVILKSHTHNRNGYVKLKSLDPTERPEINFRYFEDGTSPQGQAYGGNMNAEIDDLEAMVTGIEFVRDLVKDANKVYDHFSTDKQDLPELLGQSRFPYFQEALPGEHVQGRAELREWARRNSWGHHACGTCKMGAENDPMSVVNSRFKVIGTKGLRIVDASVFPRIPGYFIVSSIYTMSERASDDILASAGAPRRIKLDTL